MVVYVGVGLKIQWSYMQFNPTRAVVKYFLKDTLSKSIRKIDQRFIINDFELFVMIKYENI